MRWQHSSHAAPIRSIAYSPDGGTVASGAEDGTIKLWHAETGEEFFELARAPASVMKLVFSPTQDRLLGLLRSGRAVLFEGDEPARASSIAGTARSSFRPTEILFPRFEPSQSKD